MDYKTMAEIVKARGDRIIEEKRIRSMRIRRITAGFSALCAAAVVGQAHGLALDVRQIVA